MLSIWRFLTNKYVHAASALVTVMLGIYGFYQTGFKAGVYSKEAEIVALRNEVENYKSQYERWVRDTEVASQKMIDDQAKTIADLETQITNQRQHVQQTKVRYRDREITKYIPVDANTVLPVGAVWLLSRALQSEADTNTALNTIPGTTGWDPGGDSGVTLSAMVEVIEQNYLRCLQYQDRVNIWETWYRESKTNYDRALTEYQSYYLDEAN